VAVASAALARWLTVAERARARGDPREELVEGMARASAPPDPIPEASMNPLLALALATPVWGFSLQPPMAVSSIAHAPIAQVRSVVRPELPPAIEMDAERIAHNDTMMDYTRGFHLAANIGMALTGALGITQFADEYGFHDEYSQTACATGDAVLDYCGRSTPVPHLIAALGTAGLGMTSLIMSTQVDFDLAARRDGDWRTYETTRWIALGMTVVQALGGFFIANAVRFGWADEQGDFDTLQALAGAHAVWGVATLGVETYNTALLF
jgi:hypothetical protein